MNMKRCTKCGAEKPVELRYFSCDRKTKDGMSKWCLDCQKRYRELRRLRDTELGHEYNTQKRARWANLTPEERIEKAKEFWSKSQAERDALMYPHKKLQAREKSRRRADRLCNARGSHSRTDIERQYANQKGKCHYCKCDVGDKYHVDHVVPLSRGGSNGPENIVIACPTCNTSKGAKLPHEWIQGGRLL